MKPILIACLVPLVAHAQSRIDEVLVYPGGAQVTRLATVAAGARELVLNCLTARFDPDSLQITAPEGVNLGPVQIETLPRERAPECARGLLDEQLRKLEGQRDQLNAESSALETSLGYLKALGSGEARGTPAAGISATSETIRKTAQDALLRQAQIRRQLEDLERQIAPLQGERERLAGANPQWRSLRLRLSTAREAELKLSYRVTQAGWAPSYRALLDTASGALSLERLAQVSQQSGEDWKNIKLRLSTAQATPRVGVGMPPPWQLDLYRPQPAQAEARALYAPKPAPAPAPQMVTVTGARVALQEPELERFDLSVFQGSHATEFTLPLRVNIDSGTQRASLALGQEKLQAKVIARVQPQSEAAAYLVADVAPPAGSWPRGAMQLVRDGALVGNSSLNVATGEERLELPFGRDDGVRVKVEPEQRNAANTGFIGTRAEHRYGRAWVVENRHAAAVTLQLVEAAPVSQHEDIKVQTQFTPAPTTQSWRKQPGLVLWEQPLAAGQSQRFTAEYVISAPKEAQVTGLR
ncbi:MAG TPA: mucoidy inhibitor MuiA family protein [Roseateles sp.]